jgi:hypothetical protein
MLQGTKGCTVATKNSGYTRGLNEKEIRNGTTYFIDVGHDEHSRLLLIAHLVEMH